MLKLFDSMQSRKIERLKDRVASLENANTKLQQENEALKSAEKKDKEKIEELTKQGEELVAQLKELVESTKRNKRKYIEILKQASELKPEQQQAFKVLMNRIKNL